MYTSIKFFFDGFKPAIVFQNRDKEYINTIKSKGYPYSKLIPAHIVFFQTKELLQEFEKKITDGRKKGNSYDHNMAIGEAMGIPPSAVEFFVKGGTHTWLLVDFYGLCFHTTEDRLVENLKWLKKTYKVPKDYPGKIEVVDKRENVYVLEQKDINNFKLLPHNGLFVNKQAPIYQVTVMLQFVSTTVYNGFDVDKAIRAFNKNKANTPQIDVWVADKHGETYIASEINKFKDKFKKK